jgi:hypothetical protein
MLRDYGRNDEARAGGKKFPAWCRVLGTGGNELTS